jgi:hypothetical protein
VASRLVTRRNVISLRCGDDAVRPRMRLAGSVARSSRRGYELMMPAEPRSIRSPGPNGTYLQHRSLEALPPRDIEIDEAPRLFHPSSSLELGLGRLAQARGSSQPQLRWRPCRAEEIALQDTKSMVGLTLDLSHSRQPCKIVKGAHELNIACQGCVAPRSETARDIGPKEVWRFWRVDSQHQNSAESLDPS